MLVDPRIDLWAVRVVVREGTHMRLNHAERIVAAHALRERGLSRVEISERLHCSKDVVGRYWQRKPLVEPRDVESVVYQ